MRKILRAISEEPLDVSGIQEAIGEKQQSVTSQWLSQLRASMLVRWERQGKHIYYSADIEEIERCNEAVLEFLDEKGYVLNHR